MRRYLLYVFLSLTTLIAVGQNSVLNTGQWFKVSVQSDGIYQIDFSLLRSLGADPNTINPATIKVFGHTNGMLPQANSAIRQKDLLEIAVLVTGESDGKFNNGDKILFYGQGPDAHCYVPTKETFWYENHLYSDKNYYFITFGGSNGKRIAQQENLPGSFPLVNQYLDMVQFEEDKENILHSGREWFGFLFDQQTEATIQFGITDVVENSTITMVSKVMGRFYEPASFKIFYNSVEVGTQAISVVTNSTYGLKGRMKSDTLRFNSSTVGASTNASHKIKYQFIKTGTEHSIGYHDNFLVSIKRKLALDGDQMTFTLTDAVANAQSSVEIAAVVDPAVWDVTDPFLAKNQKHNFSTGKATFGLATEGIKRIAVFNEQKAMPIPEKEEVVSNQNLQGINGAAMLIISHPDFLTEAERLATHRLSHDGLEVVVVTPQQVYNEYSGGKQDVVALRDFVRDVYLKSNSNLKYVLLFGRGSYDYKDRALGNTNFVPVYESRNSLSPLETYSSDDFFGFLEEHEGMWSETSSFNHTLEVGVGRIPVRTVEDAAAIVDKLVEYDTHPKGRGQWKTDLVFVADDGDYNTHQGQANSLAIQAEALNPAMHSKKVYLDLYPQEQKSFGQISPVATNFLYRAFHEGALIINFTGHGSEQLWMQERILDPIFVVTTRNRFQYPFLITATCEFGRIDDPMIISSAEKLLVRKSAGTIGLVTTSRPVNSSSNFAINSDFYESFLNDNTSKGKPIGTVFKTTKNRGNLGVSNRNFSLLGDPSMTIGPSQTDVVVTGLTNAQSEATINGLTEYSIKGEIQKSNVLQTGFNGQVDIRIFGKPTLLTTKGDENPVFQFSEHINLIYHGSANVASGKFETKFLTSELSEVNQSSGKMILYAVDENNEEAIGSHPIVVGTSNSVMTDNTPPSISLFINDTTFINGGISNEDPMLIAKLKDNNGFDISGRETRLMTATLDDDTTFNVTNYFVNDVGQYKNGTVSFQLFGLAQGPHHIQFSAFDFLGNKSISMVEFVVGEQNQLEISKLGGWPNPFSESANIGFFHNRSGEDLEGRLTILNIHGQPMRNIEFEAPSSFFNTKITVWDGSDENGTKLASGMYILRLSVRSLQDGSKSESFGKLILTK